MIETDEIRSRLAELVAAPPTAPDVNTALLRGRARRRQHRVAAAVGTAAIVTIGTVAGANLLHPAPRSAELVVATSSSLSPAPAPAPSARPVARPRPMWTKGQAVPFRPVLTGSHIGLGLVYVNFRLADGHYLNGGPGFTAGGTPNHGAGPGTAEQAAEIGFSNGVATAWGYNSYDQVLSGLAPAGTGDITVRGDIGSVRTHPLPVPGTNIRAWAVPAVGVVSTAGIPQDSEPAPYKPDWIIAQ